MPNGADAKGLWPGNNRGTWPATPASQESAAAHSASAPPAQELCLTRVSFRWAAIEVFRRSEPDPSPIDLWDDYADDRQAIEDEFRRRLHGLRHMPRRERLHAYRAARDARLMALKVLELARVRDRSLQRLLRQLRAPTPS